MPAVAVRHERRRAEKRGGGGRRPSQLALQLGRGTSPPASPSPLHPHRANALHSELYVCGKVSTVSFILSLSLYLSPQSKDVYCWTKASSKDLHNYRSRAARIHCFPAIFVTSSIHLVGSLLTLRFPFRLCHSRTLLPQRPSVLLVATSDLQSFGLCLSL